MSRACGRFVKVHCSCLIFPKLCARGSNAKGEGFHLFRPCLLCLVPTRACEKFMKTSRGDSLPQLQGPFYSTVLATCLLCAVTKGCFVLCPVLLVICTLSRAWRVHAETCHDPRHLAMHNVFRETPRFTLDAEFDWVQQLCAAVAQRSMVKTSQRLLHGTTGMKGVKGCLYRQRNLNSLYVCVRRPDVSVSSGSRCPSSNVRTVLTFASRAENI